MDECLDHIRANIEFASLYEQLAEECAELAQAAIKASRHLRGDNPTSRTWAEIHQMLREEYTDVLVCCRALGLYEPLNSVFVKPLAKAKVQRWKERLENKNEQS